MPRLLNIKEEEKLILRHKKTKIHDTCIALCSMNQEFSLHVQMWVGKPYIKKRQMTLIN